MPKFQRMAEFKPIKIGYADQDWLCRLELIMSIRIGCAGEDCWLRKKIFAIGITVLVCPFIFGPVYQKNFVMGKHDLFFT